MKLHDKYLKTEKRRLLQPLWNEFAKHLLPFKDEGICLAVSGGADSRALLESLACDPKRSQYKYLHVVIVDHGHRVQASAEASHLYQRAVRLGFNSEIKTIENNMKNTANEAILRDYRYDALWQIAKKHGCKCLCTAHHGNDNAEGFIMDFLGLGGGQDGAAMLAVAEVEDGKILRPFTYLKSSQLRLALLALGIKVYVQDEADARCEGARAQIRNVVFPFLQQLYPSAISRAFKESVSRQEKISKAHQLCAEYETKVIFRDNNTVFIKYLQNISFEHYKIYLQQELSRLNKDRTRELRDSGQTIDKLINFFLHLNKAATSNFYNKVKSQNEKYKKSFILAGVAAIVDHEGIHLNKYIL